MAGKSAAGAEIDPGLGLPAPAAGAAASRRHAASRSAAASAVATRLVCRLPVKQQIDEARPAAPMFHVKQASELQRARLVGLRSQRLTRGRSRFKRVLAGLPRPRRTCATSSVSAAGVTPSILAAWPMVRGLLRDQLLPDLVRQARQRRVIEVVRQREAFVAPIRRDVGGLAREIDLVFGVDLDLLGDLRRATRRSAARSARDRPCRCPDTTGARTRSGAGRPC